MLRTMFKAMAGFDAVAGLRLVQWPFKAVAGFTAAGAGKVCWKYMEIKPKTESPKTRLKTAGSIKSGNTKQETKSILPAKDGTNQP